MNDIVKNNSITIPIGVSIVSSLGLAYYYHTKNKELNDKLIELEKKIETYDAKFEQLAKIDATLSQLVPVVNHLYTQQPATSAPLISNTNTPLISKSNTNTPLISKSNTNTPLISKSNTTEQNIFHPVSKDTSTSFQKLSKPSDFNLETISEEEFSDSDLDELLADELDELNESKIEKDDVLLDELNDKRSKSKSRSKSLNKSKGKRKRSPVVEVIG